MVWAECRVYTEFATQFYSMFRITGQVLLAWIQDQCSGIMSNVLLVQESGIEEQVVGLHSLLFLSCGQHIFSLCTAVICRRDDMGKAKSSFLYNSVSSLPLLSFLSLHLHFLRYSFACLELSV